MANNRRDHRRLKIDKSVEVSVQINPAFPFIGETIDAHLLNISAGGMFLVVEKERVPKQLRKGTKIKIHFRLPGHPIQLCQGFVRFRAHQNESDDALGIRFTTLSKSISKNIQHMAEDNAMCDRRLQENHPWCQPICSFYQLCRKPHRIPHASTKKERMEIAFQPADPVHLA